MDNATELISVSPAAAPTTQLALRSAELDTDDSWAIVDGSVELPEYVQRRMRVIQQLLAARGTKTYVQVQQQAARSLGISVRSLRRLVKAWQELGVAGLLRQPRSDQGSIKVSQEWQDFIVKTYKDGNRGSRQMSPAQIVVQVRSRAQRLGVEDYPGRTTVYRILRPHIEKVQQKRTASLRQGRTLGWRADRLTLHTREGLAIAIEWSNQVWQVDHTRADVLVVDQSGEVLGRPWLTIRA